MDTLNSIMYTIRYEFDPDVKKYMDYLVEKRLQEGGDGEGYFGPDGEIDYSVFQMSNGAVNWIKSLPPDELNWEWLARNNHPDIIKICEENEDKINQNNYLNRNKRSSDKNRKNYTTTAKNLIEQYLRKKNIISLNMFCINLTYTWDLVCLHPLFTLKNLKDPKMAEFIINKMINLLHERKTLIFFLEISPFLLETFFQKNYLDRFFEYGYGELSRYDMFVPEIIKTPHRISKISWYYFSQNPHPDVIPFLRNDLDKVCWNSVCDNPNVDKLLCRELYMYNYPCILEKKEILHEELMKYFWSPERLKKIAHRDHISFEEAVVRD